MYTFFIILTHPALAPGPESPDGDEAWRLKSLLTHGHRLRKVNFGLFLLKKMEVKATFMLC